MPSLEVCLTPELIHLYPPKGKTVVVVDILRATSCMVTALSEGIESITPVATVEECEALGQQGYLTAGERGGQKVESFDLGNSPLSYLEQDYSGRKLAMTTTNGTLAISKSKGADKVLIGAFLNLSALTGTLSLNDNDLLILCSGWKGKVSFEDTLFAGALCSRLSDQYEMTCDSGQIALAQYEHYKTDLLAAIKHSSHYQRLSKLGTIKDFAFCVEVDRYEVVPRLEGEVLVK